MHDSASDECVRLCLRMERQKDQLKEKEQLRWFFLLTVAQL